MDKIYLDDQNFLKIKIDGDTSKPKIIFSNSLGSDLSMWDPQVEYFKKIGEDVVASPVISDGNLYIVTRSSKIIGFN